jgi:hypothetical protein
MKDARNLPGEVGRVNGIGSNLPSAPVAALFNAGAESATIVSRDCVAARTARGGLFSEAMMKRDEAGKAGAGGRPRKAARPFQPTWEQRAFVAAAAGLRVPRSLICQMLPGARRGETVSISRDMLRREFEMELRDGLTLVMALVEARVFQRALAQEDRSALAAQMALLNARGGWKLPAAQMAAAPEPDRRFNADLLTREERAEMKRLLLKGMPELAERDRTQPRKRL